MIKYKKGKFKKCNKLKLRVKKNCRAIFYFKKSTDNFFLIS